MRDESYKRELDKPDEEKAKKRFGRDVCRNGQWVFHPFPGRTENASQAGRQEVGAVESLDSVRNGTNDGPDKDEEE